MANPVPIFAPSHLAMVCLHPSWCNDLFNAMCKKSVTYDLWKTTSLKLENKSWREFFHQLETPKLRYFQYLSKRMLHVFQAIHVLDFVELPTGPQQINTSSCIISKKNDLSKCLLYLFLFGQKTTDWGLQQSLGHYSWLIHWKYGKGLWEVLFSCTSAYCQVVTGLYPSEVGVFFEDEHPSQFHFGIIFISKILFFVEVFLGGMKSFSIGLRIIS